MAHRAIGRRARLTALTLLVMAPALLPLSPLSARSAPTPSTGADLVIGTTEEPDTLNPLLAQSAAAQQVDSAVFDGLLRVDSHDTLQPDLALTWTHSHDGRTWTFHLRRGVHWADGRPFTSADVAWTYKQIVNPGTQIAAPQGWDQVDRLMVPDPDTVIIHLRRLLAPWLLTVGTTAILPQHALATQHSLATAPYNRLPFGTGPYRVTAWTPGKRIVLTANPRSWRGAPHYSTLVFRFFASDSQLLAALHAGAARVGRINAGQVSYAKQVGLRVVAAPSMRWYHVDLKQWGPLRDLAVRQALDYATPRDQIIRQVALGHGQAAFADIAPALTPYYDPSLRPRPYLPSRAGSLLEGAGYHRDAAGVRHRCAAGKPKQPCAPLAITLWSIEGDSFGAAINHLLADSWTAIGVQISQRREPASQLFGPGGPQFTRAATGITYAWSNGDDPDDRFYWNSVSIPPYPSAAGGADVAYFHRFAFQSTLDRLTNLGVETTDPTRRQVVYRRIQALLQAQAPVLFLYWEDQLWVAPRGLQGFAPSPFTDLAWNAAAWR